MLKPGVINRRIVGEIISRLERKGLQLVGMKMLQVSDATAASHYAEHVGKSFYQELVDYITSGPVVAMAWQGDDCVSLVRKLVGSTKPSDAQPGTIRGDYCIHTNDSEGSHHLAFRSFHFGLEEEMATYSSILD